MVICSNYHREGNNIPLNGIGINKGKRKMEEIS
jgi:hypothetical protein